MVLRWRKNPRPAGLARVCAGPCGSTLRLDGNTQVAAVYSVARDANKWFWVAGYGHPKIPYKNTCYEPPQTEVDAKVAALAYVKHWLATE